jgi:hypothetical protein
MKGFLNGFCFLLNLEEEVQLPIGNDIDKYNKVHDHYIPLHLMSGHWGAHRLLQQAMSNKKKGVDEKAKRELNVMYS